MYWSFHGNGTDHKFTLKMMKVYQRPADDGDVSLNTSSVVLTHCEYQAHLHGSDPFQRSVSQTEPLPACRKDFPTQTRRRKRAGVTQRNMFSAASFRITLTSSSINKFNLHQNHLTNS
ncbi:hypothetical protein GOODEAATRI_010541 [Goodea atripinnis]|uniref:Uncharacterized protein n=1 Tax=Goodea atripinnis TaxID=208336 RepID=A0ABV0N0A3_9TELE